MQTVTEPQMQWWLDLVLSRASELRKAGVATISADGYSVSLLPAEPEPQKLEPVTNDERQSDGLNPLEDPHSYPGGIVPGFVITRELPEE